MAPNGILDKHDDIVISKPLNEPDLAGLKEKMQIL